MNCRLLLLSFVLLLATCFSQLSAVAAAEGEIPVSKIVLSGNNALEGSRFSALLKQYEGSSLKIADLREIAAQITAEYRKLGYLLANTYLPEQKIVNGVVELRVVEGTIGRIKIEGKHKYYSDDFIRSHLQPVMEDKAFNQDRLERALLLLNEYPLLKVTAMLQPGTEPGTADLLVTANNGYPVKLGLDYNNYGSHVVSGIARFGATFEVGNLLKEGSLLSLRAVSGQDVSDFFYGRASYSIPLNTLGTKLGAYYLQGNFDVGREFAELGMTGKTKGFGLYASHPFIKKRTENLTGEIGYDSKKVRQYVFDDILLTEDDISSVHAGLGYEKSSPSGRTFVSVFVTQGLGHVLGGMDEEDPMASQAGADNSFTKVNVNAVHIQEILPWLYLMAKGSGQYASDSLAVSEQFSIGGADTVRGYVLGEYLGDDGYAVTGEFRVSPFSDRELLQLAFFIDNGSIQLKNPGSGGKTSSLTGAGAGVRMSLPYDFSVKVDAGFPICPSRGADGYNAMYYIQVTKNF